MFNAEMTRHLAELSKTAFTDSELEKMTADMTDIIKLMDKVREFEGCAEPYTLPPVGCGKLREDKRGESYPAEEITKNATVSKNNSFVVPKVV